MNCWKLNPKVYDSDSDDSEDEHFVDVKEETLDVKEETLDINEENLDSTADVKSEDDSTSSNNGKDDIDIDSDAGYEDGDGDADVEDVEDVDEDDDTKPNIEDIKQEDNKEGIELYGPTKSTWLHRNNNRQDRNQGRCECIWFSGYCINSNHE